MKLHERIKQERLNKNISSNEIADMCEVDRSTLQRFENGKNGIRSQLLQKVCDVLDLELSKKYNCCEDPKNKRLKNSENGISFYCAVCNKIL